MSGSNSNWQTERKRFPMTAAPPDDVIEGIVWIAQQARECALAQAIEVVANAKIDKARKWDIVCAITALKEPSDEA